MRARSLFLVILIFTMVSSYAQVAITATGGDGTGSGGSAAYTVGQILYSSSSSASGGMIHGVQLPYEIWVINDLVQYEESGLIISTYPNPVGDVLLLKVESPKWNDLYMQMYNSDGEVIYADMLWTTETNILMSHLAPGVYFLQVIRGKDAVKTFKIIKK